METSRSLWDKFAHLHQVSQPQAYTGAILTELHYVGCMYIVLLILSIAGLTRSVTVRVQLPAAKNRDQFTPIPKEKVQ